ncbi:putative ribonuclease H-like domain-containing protein [Tanacetum coccineum]
MTHKKFQMSSMGELTFFLGLQVKQKEDGIFISQDKYVTTILKKFGFSDVKTASTPMETYKPLLKDADGEDVDEHMSSQRVLILEKSHSLSHAHNRDKEEREPHRSDRAYVDKISWTVGGSARQGFLEILSGRSTSGYTLEQLVTQLFVIEIVMDDLERCTLESLYSQMVGWQRVYNNWVALGVRTDLFSSLDIVSAHTVQWSLKLVIEFLETQSGLGRVSGVETRGSNGELITTLRRGQVDMDWWRVLVFVVLRDRLCMLGSGDLQGLLEGGTWSVGEEDIRYASHHRRLVMGIVIDVEGGLIFICCDDVNWVGWWLIVLMVHGVLGDVKGWVGGGMIRGLRGKSGEVIWNELEDEKRNVSGIDWSDFLKRLSALSSMVPYVLSLAYLLQLSTSPGLLGGSWLACSGCLLLSTSSAWATTAYSVLGSFSCCSIEFSSLQLAEATVHFLLAAFCAKVHSLLLAALLICYALLLYPSRPSAAASVVLLVCAAAPASTLLA